MEAQRASRSGGRPRFAVALLMLGLIALVLGGLLFFQLLTVEQFFAALVLAFILALGLFFTIRARGVGGKILALLGALILLVVVSGVVILSNLSPLQWEASAPTATVNPGAGVTPTDSPGSGVTPTANGTSSPPPASPAPTFAATATPTLHAPGASVDFALAEFGVSIISMVAGILSVIVSVIALFAARSANRPPSAS